MKQHEAVIKVMEENKGFATLNFLYENVLKVKNVEWKTKTPFATMRRIVQDSRFFFKIKPGLWALNSYKSKLPENITGLIEESKSPLNESKKYTHYYYQGVLAEIGQLNHYKTYIPPQDKNRPFLNKKLNDVITMTNLPEFTFKNILNVIKTIDIIWFNERNFPQSVFEIEHSTDFKNSLNKFYELIDFNVKMVIVANNVRLNQFKSVMNLSVFKNLENRVQFCNYEYIENYYSDPFKNKGFRF